MRPGHPGDQEVGRRAEVGQVVQAVVGKVALGVRAAPAPPAPAPPLRWMMEYLHSCLIQMMCEAFYATALHVANSMNFVRGEAFISLFIVGRGGRSRSVKKCLNSSRIPIC